MRNQVLTIGFPTDYGGFRQKKTAGLGVGARAGGHIEVHAAQRTKTSREFNLDRLDEALFNLGLGVVDELQAAGFDERAAWQASMAAVDAAIARLDQVAAEMIRGRA